MGLPRAARPAATRVLSVDSEGRRCRSSKKVGLRSLLGPGPPRLGRGVSSAQGAPPSGRLLPTKYPKPCAPTWSDCVGSAEAAAQLPTRQEPPGRPGMRRASRRPGSPRENPCDGRVFDRSGTITRERATLHGPSAELRMSLATRLKQRPSAAISAANGFNSVWRQSVREDSCCRPDPRAMARARGKFRRISRCSRSAR